MSDYKTVAEALKFYMEKCGEDTPYFIFRDREGGRDVFTFGRLHRLAGRCAALLRHKGIGKGSLAMVCLDNSPESLVCVFGLLYAGAVCINGVCERPDGSDFIHCLRHSHASAVLLDPDVTRSPWTPLQDIVQRADDGTVTSEKLPYLKHVEFVRRHPETGFLGYLEKLKEWFMEDEVQGEDNCFVFTTSGSTGLPKLVAHNHNDFVTLMQKWSRTMVPPGSPRSVRFQDTPLGTSGGNVTLPLMLNETRVLCDFRAGLPQDRAAFITRSIREERCTKATLKPAMVLSIHRRVKQEKEASSKTFNGNNHQCNSSVPLEWEGPLDQIGLGGQPITSRAVDSALELARTVLVYYGCTELGLISVAMVKKGGSYEDYNVGHLVPGAQVKVVDEKTGTPVPVGQIGQVLIKYPTSFTDYMHDLKDPTKPLTTAAFTDDGFYHTGDRGKLNDDKSLTIFGRTGETVIVRGDTAYYSHVIEAALSGCSGIADVVVVGVPDPVTKEEFCACVVLEEGASLTEVQEEVEKKFAGPSATLRPRYYLEFDSLPQLCTDRPNRALIKQIAREREA